MIYDFLLFENFHLAQHHKFDVVLIARMLQSQGLKVAIFDIYHEDSLNIIEDIPVLHWYSKHKVPDDSWMLKKHSFLETIVKGYRFKFQLYFYMKEVKSFIENKADYFYCGSYHSGISTVLFKIKKPCYYWGLRSNRLSISFDKFIRSPFDGLRLLCKRNSFLRNPFQRLFVSNPIIFEEFLNIGVPLNRMIIREERVVESVSDAQLQNLDKKVSFLVIGQLRKEKHIPITVSAFKKANIPNSHLKLIGRSSQDYEECIKDSIQDDNRIYRVNEYLKYEDFYNYISKSHFVLFADEKGPSCITNGTMTEALINHRPVICPDYNPYSFYIKKYGVGLLYNSGNIDSYANAIQQAAKLGVEYFLPAINEFLKTISFEKVSKQFVIDLKKQID